MTPQCVCCSQILTDCISQNNAIPVCDSSICQHYAMSYCGYCTTCGNFNIILERSFDHGAFCSELCVNRYWKKLRTKYNDNNNSDGNDSQSSKFIKTE